MTTQVGPSESFQLALAMYQGPPENLLPLVKAGQLSVDDLPLADVTAQFLAYLAAQPEVDLDLTAEFLAAAGRLVLAKSATLLAWPAPQEEELEPAERPGPTWCAPAAAGELRLLEGRESFPPGPRPDLPDRVFEPQPAGSLLRAWSSLRSRRERPVVRVSVPSFVRLEAALSSLIRRMKAQIRASFRGIVQGMEPQDAVVYFLGLLELIRRRRVEARQRDLFGDISMEWVGSDEARSSRVG